MKTIRIIIYTLAAIMGVVLFRLAHAEATAVRGYEAIGGEVFLLLLPVYVYIIRGFVVDSIRNSERNGTMGQNKNITDQDEFFTIIARRCKRCNGILTSRQAVEDGYGHVCKMKAMNEKIAKQPVNGQMSLSDDDGAFEHR